MRGNARSPALGGSWRLLYSNAREINNLASGLPLGFVLGPTFQPVDLAAGTFENQCAVLHVLGLAKASTTVVGDVRPAAGGTRNAAGTEDLAGNRIDIDFHRLTFSLDELLGVPLPRAGLQKVIVTKPDPTAPQPANDISYLDREARVTRGGDDSLFIFRREAAERPMLTLAEREALYAKGGSGVTTGRGEAGEGAPPELKRLLKGR